jgi:hypothetical protein
VRGHWELTPPLDLRARTLQVTIPEVRWQHQIIRADTATQGRILARTSAIRAMDLYGVSCRAVVTGTSGS